METNEETVEVTTVDTELDTSSTDTELDTSQYITYNEDGTVELNLDAYNELMEDIYEDNSETYVEYNPNDNSYTVTTTTNGVSSEQMTGILGALAGAMWFMIIFGVALGVYTAIVNFKISKKMGRSTAFGVLAIFFWPIMSGILAFSKDKKPIESAGGLAPSDVTPEPSPVPDFSKPIEPATPTQEPIVPASEPVVPETPVETLASESAPAPASDAPAPETPASETPAPETPATPAA